MGAMASKSPISRLFIQLLFRRRSKKTNFAVYGLKFLFEISKVPFEISHKIFNPYPVKYAFYEVLKIWRLTIS